MNLLLQLIYTRLLQVTENVSFNMLPEDVDTSQLYIIYEVNENDVKNALDLKNYATSLNLTVKILHSDSFTLIEAGEQVKELLLEINDIGFNSSIPIFSDPDLGLEQLTLNFEIDHYAGIAGLAIARRLTGYSVQELRTGLTQLQKDGLGIGRALEEYSNEELQAGLTSDQIAFLQLYKALYSYTAQELQNGLTNAQKESLQLYKALTAYTTLELKNGLTPEQLASLQNNIALQDYTVQQLQAGLTNAQIQGLQLYKALSQYTESELNSGLSTAQKDALQYALSTYLVADLKTQLTPAQINGLQLYKALDVYSVGELLAGLTAQQIEGLQLNSDLDEYTVQQLQAGLTPDQIAGLQLYKALDDYTNNELADGLTESQIDFLQLYQALDTYTVQELQAGLTPAQIEGLQENPEPVVIAAPSNLSAVASGVGVLLSWNGDPSADGFIIEKATIGNGFVEIAQTGNVNSYQDNDILEGEFYFYVVKAFKGSAESGYSNIYLFIKQSETVTVPAQVPGLTAEEIAGNTFVLSWNAPDDGGAAIVGYKIEYQIKDGEEWITAEENTGNQLTTYELRYNTVLPLRYPFYYVN